MRREQFGEAEFALDLENDPTRLTYGVGTDRRIASWAGFVTPVLLVLAYAAISVLIDDEELSGVANALLNAVPALLGALIFYWAKAELRFEHGAVVRVLGRFPPKFRTETPLSAFEGVAWWVDGDAPEAHGPASRFAHVLELRHREDGRSVPIFRRVGGPRPLSEHAAYAGYFGLPALAPPVGRIASHPFGPADLARRDWAQDAPSPAPSPDRLVETDETQEATAITFPFRPPGWLNEWTIGGLALAMLPVLLLVFQLIDGETASDVYERLTRSPIGFVVFWVVVAGMIAPFWIGVALTRPMSRRRVRVAVNAVGLDTQGAATGESWLIAHDSILEVVEGRKSSQWTWRDGAHALFAVGETDAAPVAYRLDARTKSELAAALADAVQRWRTRAPRPLERDALEPGPDEDAITAENALPTGRPGYLRALMTGRRPRP
ncbi:MAG: hypothetical protein AAFR11_05165 [Pseudomonadota bacterium]